MAVFYHKEPQINTPKKCNFLSACLKDPSSYCHAFSGRLSTSSPDEADDNPTSEFDDEQEEVVLAIRTGAQEKLRKKPIVPMMSDSLSWVYSPMTKELYMTPKGFDQKEEASDIEQEEFLSVKSSFSRCTSCTGRDVFMSVKTSFSRCSSLSDISGVGFGFFIDLDEFQRRSMIMTRELCQCQGWPFGLCRKAFLLPPLPKSPSESWLWCKKGTKSTIKLAY